MSKALAQLTEDVAAIVGGDHALEALWSPQLAPAVTVRGTLTELPATAGGGVSEHHGREIEFISAEIYGVEIGDMLDIDDVTYFVSRVEDIDTWGLILVGLHD